MSDEPSTVDRECGLDAVFGSLDHATRRRLVDCLARYDGPISLADAAEAVAVERHGTPIQGIPAEEVRDVYMALYHTHVPELVDSGAVAYDQDRDLVALTERGERLVDVLETVDESPEG